MNKLTASFALCCCLFAPLALSQNPGTLDPLDALNDDLDAIEWVPGAGLVGLDRQRLQRALQRSGGVAGQVIERLLDSEDDDAVAMAVSALEAINRASVLAGHAAGEEGFSAVPRDLLDSLSSSGAVLEALSARAEQLTPAQRQRLRTVMTDTIDGSLQLIGADLDRSALIELVTATAEVLSAGALSGVPLGPLLVNEARGLGDMALMRGAADFPALAGVSDTALFRDRLRADVNALEFALAVSPQISRAVRPDIDSARIALMQRGGSGADASAERLARALAHVVEADRLHVNDRSVAQVMLDSVAQGGNAGPGAPFDIEMAPGTRTLIIRLPGEQYYGAVSAVRLVSERVPAGLSLLRDGRALLVHEGVGVELAPVPRDIIAFAVAIENAGFEFNLREQGRIELGLGAGQRFSAVTAFDNLPGVAADCAVVRFAEPDAPVDAPEHAFRAICPDGSAQRILPFVHSGAFYDALIEAGFDAVTDRNTGVIRIAGVGHFKPGFFFDELTTDELEYWEANRSASGIAFRFIDLTGNGVDDVLMLSNRGVQPIYWVDSAQ